MNLRSPIVAVLWEAWRVTRVEAAWRLALGVVLTPAAVIWSAVVGPVGTGAWDFARIVLFLPHIMGWLTLAALNAGKPGFPFSLHYARPIRTAAMVGVPMVYLTAVSFAIYLVSALLLRVTSGYPYSVLPAAAWIATFALVLGALAWSSRSVLLTMLGSLVLLFAGGKRVGVRLDSFPNDASYPLTDYAVMALIGLVCFGVTVASVARQRRGDGQAATTRVPGSGVWGWLIDLFRSPCPTSSATRAQVWMDLKSSGVPVLTIGVAFAIVILLVSAVSGPVDAALNADPDVSCQIEDCFFVRAMPPLMLTPFSLIAVFFLGRNVFGIHRKHGRAYMSAFAATQAYGTAQLAILKILVQSACVLAALIAIAVSLWISMPLLGDPVFVQIWGVPLSSRRPVVIDAFAALTGYEQLALALVAAVGVVIVVAAFAVFGALRTRYSRRASIAAFLLVLYGLVFVWLTVLVTVEPDIASHIHMDVVYSAMRGIATAAMVFTTVYVCWSGFTERVLTIRYASGAFAVSAAFGAAWLTVLHMAGVQLAGMSAINAVSILSPGLLPLLVSVLAPWSLSRVRHT